MHLAWKNTTFRAPALSQKFDQILRLPRKVRLHNHLWRKVTLQNHQMARVPSKVTLQHHQMLRLPQKNVIVSFLDCYFTAPFLTGLLRFSTTAFLSWTYPWTCLWWTMPFLHSSFTELFLYWTSPLLNALILLLNLRNSEVSPPKFLWQQPANSRLRDQKNRNTTNLIANIRQIHKLLKTLGHARRL